MRTHASSISVARLASSSALGLALLAGCNGSKGGSGGSGSGSGPAAPMGGGSTSPAASAPATPATTYVPPAVSSGGSWTGSSSGSSSGSSGSNDSGGGVSSGGVVTSGGPSASGHGTTSSSSGASGGATAEGSGGGTGGGLPGGTGSGTSAPNGLPSSAVWMSEDEEVSWINSLGFRVTVADLRASYANFKVQPVNSSMNVLWDTESDELRNFLRLYQRTGYKPFLDQATSWHDFMVNTYSQWQNGHKNVVEPEHVYLMGLIDWYVTYKDQATLDAIGRILDFIEKQVNGNPFFETRVSARCIQDLAYYLEKIGTRRADVLPKLQEFVTGVLNAPESGGLIPMTLMVNASVHADRMPSTDDLRQLFPQDAQKGIVTSAQSYELSKGGKVVGLYQDCILVHALTLASRVLQQPNLDQLAAQIANAWQQWVKPPFWDPQGLTNNVFVPYYMITDAPEKGLFLHADGGSTPLYVTQFAAYCTDPQMKRTLATQALLRQYGQYDKVKPSELGGKPGYWPWQTYEDGYFLLQK